MLITFSENVWEDYTYWQSVGKKIVKKDKFPDQRYSKKSVYRHR